MTRIVYVNGAYKRYAEAAIHAEDRGFQFADAVYEVIEVLDGRLVDATRHLARLARSLGELAIARPMSDRALLNIIGEVLHRNRVRNGIVYIQVTRGAGPRNFSFPGPEIFPTLIVLARAQRRGWADELAEQGITIKTMPDNRWGRSDIKTVMLLPAVLAKDAARRDGANEAWFVDSSGAITEGASSNAWIVTGEGVLVTRQLDTRILPGITRATVNDIAASERLKVEERAFTLSEALKAREAFVTSATNTVMPVVAIDGKAIGEGRPGPVARRLRSRFHQLAEISIV
ncbi:class IV aminotransferase [Hyphomicrobium denitrificans 1NES1]|uniref:Probable branched-chain-amino-acid aminotransferase n=1 Tax=Hyphomicrobium denitrificans 1NES1 TaxID=670307 RepID=N0B2J4_9HYPH|nr:D-amino-acid transaminase [Hyphomicrobium denitrificans]AGK57739.1 class IV aminotransferase [Hyphomicrobium denitrificans 1NES1]